MWRSDCPRRVEVGAVNSLANVQDQICCPIMRQAFCELSHFVDGKPVLHYPFLNGRSLGESASFLEAALFGLLCPFLPSVDHPSRGGTRLLSQALSQMMFVQGSMIAMLGIVDTLIVRAAFLVFQHVGTTNLPMTGLDSGCAIEIKDSEAQVLVPSSFVSFVDAWTLLWLHICRCHCL